MAKEHSHVRESSSKHDNKLLASFLSGADKYEAPSEDEDSCYTDSDYEDEDFDDDDDDDSDDPWSQCFLVDDGLLLHFQRFCAFHSSKKDCQNETPVKLYNSEMAAKNAQQLVDEEEREKRKADKRRAKKKRRREKKKEEKERMLANKTVNSETEKPDSLTEKKSTKSSKSSPSKPSSSAEDADDGEEFLDINSAFVSVVASKKKKNGTLPTTGIEKARAPKKSQSSGDQLVAESERLAVIGYKMASKEQYEQAVEYFTKAIRLVHNDHRFFSNRSFCHCQLGHYTKALKDADKAITLAPSSPKGYYRRGEALKGLSQYKEAEEAFEKVVELDEESEDAIQELEYVKLQQLLEMGFAEKQAVAALQQYHSVQAAVEALTSSKEINSEMGGEHVGDIFYSDDEESIASVPSSHVYENHSQQPPLTLSSKTNKMDPSNPEGHLSLWVGNISQEVTEKQLIDIFSKFGVVVSVRLLPEKYCAFINFRDKSSPGPAMKCLQNRELGGERLLIRYPNNPVPETHQQILKKTTKSSAAGAQAKVTGPVNGDECHFWRTTGCAFGNKCRYKHLKENKGVDKKPWQKAS